MVTPHLFFEVFTMIRNLNQITFKGFGTVCAEKASGEPAVAKAETVTTLELHQGDAPIFQAASEVVLYFHNGMTVLSVSKDCEDFQHFYLDKTVRLLPGTYFCLSPFRTDSGTAKFTAEIPPVDTSKKHKVQDFQLQHRLRVTDLYTFFYHEKEKGFFFPGEAHPMLELTYVDQGTLHSVADGRDTLLSQGDLTIYGPNQWHMQYTDMDVAPHYVTISFDIDGSDVHKLIDRKFRIPQKATSLMQQLLNELEPKDDYATDTIISLLNLLLLNLLRQDGNGEGKLQTAKAVHSENEIIRKAQQYVSTHIREKLSVPLVARMVDVSPSYLTALFHKNLQIAPGEYIRRIKLQESKVMIREGKWNFTEIAAILQYSTVHHFSRQFKEKFGITPTEYAKSVR